jgi:hypothetical protein
MSYHLLIRLLDDQEGGMIRVHVALSAALALAGCDAVGPDADFRSQAIAELKASLKDPGSAQLRAIEVIRQEDGSKALCGEVNAKNSFGGYVGFQSFVVHNGEASMRSVGIVGSDGSTAGLLDEADAIMRYTELCIAAETKAIEAEIVRKYGADALPPKADERPPA